MPKETVVPLIAYVYDADGKQVDEGLVHAVRPTPEGGHVSFSSGLEVMWTRDGWVQLGIDVPRALLRSLVAELDNNPDTVASAVYVDLSRYQVNRLISTVRRARNAAFGADE